MNAVLDRKRILVYLGFAFGIAWVVGLIIFLTGGLADSPVVVPGIGLTLAVALLSVAYMGAPALAHVFTRLITREGWKNTSLRLNLRRGWRFYLAAWLLPGLLAIVGGVIYFVLFPGHFSTANVEALSAQGVTNPWVFVGIQVLFAMLISPLINGLFTFGEEFGWRAYLLPRLMPLGERKAMLAMGVIWGVWHWPVIAMGHNYGFDYPGAPWLGLLVMVWFTFVLGVLINWVALRSGSVWPAVIAHAAVNGIGSLMVLFTQGQPNPLLGPTVAGLIGSLGFALFALVLLTRPYNLRRADEIHSNLGDSREQPAIEAL